MSSKNVLLYLKAVVWDEGSFYCMKSFYLNSRRKLLVTEELTTKPPYGVETFDISVKDRDTSKGKKNRQQHFFVNSSRQNLFQISSKVIIQCNVNHHVQVYIHAVPQLNCTVRYKTDYLKSRNHSRAATARLLFSLCVRQKETSVP